MWFKADLLNLNFHKTHFIQFSNRSTCTCTSNIQITYEDEQIPTANATKFLGLFINNIFIKLKLSSACFAMWSFQP